MKEEDEKEIEFFPEPEVPKTPDQEVEEEMDEEMQEDLRSFEKAQEEGTLENWADQFVRNKRRHRYEAVAHLAASGMDNIAIGKEMGITPGRVSIITNATFVRNRVKEIQAKYWGGSIEKRFKNSVPKAFTVMEDLMMNSEKDNVKLDAAKWLLEKVTGKAIQSVNIESNTLTDLMGALDSMKTVESSDGREIIDVGDEDRLAIDAPNQEEKKLDPMDEWISKNVPTHKGVGHREK